MDNRLMKTITELCLINGISGDESKVAGYITDAIKDYCETVSIDKTGNVIAFKKGLKRREKKLMVAAHMDEVGFIVTSITDSGMLKFKAVGGVYEREVLGKRVVVGEDVSGVVAYKPIHLSKGAEREEIPSYDTLYIDIGAKTKEEAENAVNIADSVSFITEPELFGDGLIKAKALDDRIGCGIMIELIKSELLYDTWFVFTTQEEVGLRGARVASYTVEPDACIVIEGTTAADLTFVEDDKKVCYLKKGAVISFMDKSTIYDKGLYQLCMKIARENDIRIQAKQVVAGGNDSGAIHLSKGGVRTLAVSVPCRYLHGPSTTAAVEDIMAVKALVSEMINRSV